MNLAEAVAILERTPQALLALLGGLPSEWTMHRPEPGWWSANDVLGHLIDGERKDWISRAHVIIERGESEPFAPLDREGWRAETTDRMTAELLEEFRVLRVANLDELRAMGAGPRLDARGVHPELGPVTLGQLIATWAVHDLNHLGQILEAMAKRYGSDVGPWRAFLPVLNRPMEDSG